jgi:acetylglutamate kinase
VRPTVLKFGGELLEDPAHLTSVVAAVTTAIARGAGAFVIVHGGGKEIDAALKTAGIEKKQADGLRITDDATLDVAVAVLAGTINTRFVAALNAAGVRAVGLTGADAKLGLSRVAPPHHTVDGRTIDLGRVGIPVDDADCGLLDCLIRGGFVPVIACVGIGGDGRLLNINADTLAGALAVRCRASRLVVAGATAGVLDKSGATLATLDAGALSELVNDGTASAGMIAKLRACEHALGGGVDEVVIVDGRRTDALVAAALDGDNDDSSDGPGGPRSEQRRRSTRIALRPANV